MNISTNSEVWKDVVGYEGLYKISEYGEILITKRNKPLKPHRHRGGYDRASLSRQGRKKKLLRAQTGWRGVFRATRKR